MPSRRGQPSAPWLLVAVAAACLAPIGVHSVIEATSAEDVQTAGLSTQRPETEGGDATSSSESATVGSDRQAAGGTRRSSSTTASTTSTTAARPTTTTAPTTTAPSTTATTSPPPTTAPPATTATTRPPAPPTPTDEVLALVNDARAATGCQALAVDERLQRAAQLHSEDMSARDYMEHTTPEGADPSDRARAQGFDGPGVGENIAMGYDSPEAVMDGWMNSPGHRANIENCDYRVIGIGLDADGWYWAQVFGM